MSTRIWLALALAVGLAAPASAQSPGLPGAVGTGPQTDVQLSPNGTIDVAGARGGDLDLTGGNLRSNLGASRIQPSPITPPTLPAPALGGSPWRPPGSVDFGAGLAPLEGSSAGEKASGGRESREASIEDLILPRFRSTAAGAAAASSASAGGPSASGPSINPPADWRYRYYRGRWWYWQPPGAWLVWNGSQWQSF